MQGLTTGLPIVNHVRILGPFCMNYCTSEVWNWVKRPVALEVCRVSLVALKLPSRLFEGERFSFEFNVPRPLPKHSPTSLPLAPPLQLCTCITCGIAAGQRRMQQALLSITRLYLMDNSEERIKLVTLLSCFVATDQFFFSWPYSIGFRLSKFKIKLSTVTKWLNNLV